MTRGPNPSHPITLTPDETATLRRLIRAHRTPQSVVMRAEIVLTAAEQPTWTNPQIAAASGTSARIVRKWRRRWVETHTLTDAPRSGAPRRFSP
jgi:hypothetical protein